MGGEPSYERLSAQDASFLQFENACSPSHVTAAAGFEGRGRPPGENAARPMRLGARSVAPALPPMPGVALDSTAVAAVGRAAGGLALGGAARIATWRCHRTRQAVDAMAVWHD